MLITCDEECNMGYIYVMPTRDFENGTCSKAVMNEVSSEKLKIEYILNSDVVSHINKMKLKKCSYSEAVEKVEIDEEYKNNLDENGYIEGIELTLSKSKFLSLIRNMSFKVYKIVWQGNEYNLLTLDDFNSVFHESNVIYPMSKLKDCYAICSTDNKYSLCFIRGIISSREDIYPLGYWLEASFWL